MLVKILAAAVWAVCAPVKEKESKIKCFDVYVNCLYVDSEGKVKEKDCDKKAREYEQVRHADESR